jgi:subtilisin family serine protease
MSDSKDDAAQAARATQSRKPAQGTNSTDTGGDQAAGVRGSVENRLTATVSRRKQRYLIGLRTMPGVVAGQSEAFLDRLSVMEGVQIVRKLRPRGSPAYSAEGITSVQDIVIAQMDEQRGAALRQHAPPHVIVEIDAPIGNSDLAALEPFGWQLRARAMPLPRPARALRFEVLGAGDRPPANTGINVFGPGFPTQATTDASGHASVQTFAGDAADIQALYLRPAADHWEHYLPTPSIDFERVNVVRLKPLNKKPSKSASERPHGWGQRAMQFDRLSAEWSGVGVKVGIIDSGCDTAHPSLRHVTHGIDLTREHDPESWRTDELGHGTHCAGIIAGRGVPGAEFVGCAPGSEVHVFKIAPGGFLSDVIDALDLCIERRIDVVQIGVQGDQYSELLAQKISTAQLHGVACIIGSGNSGGPVQFPAGIPGVLTVGAIGQFGEFPPDTRHAQRALPQLLSAGGLFSTYFSCWGPQVAVCAPGVAIISTVPGGGFAAWDGSAMAAAHVTGLAALLLSHHAALQVNRYAGHVEQRVGVLFELIRAAARPLPQMDPNRAGAGLPELERVPSMAVVRRHYGYAAGMPEPGLGATPVYPGDPGAAIRQLQAAGLWR